MATAEYIGALISLISKSDIRYQGLLASINPEQATIALEKVRSWGTEGRVSAQGRPQEEIPPSDHVYEYIMFRAADVKDLKIDDANPPKQAPVPPQPALNDPAILNSSAQQPGPAGGFGAPAGMYGMPPAPYGAPFPGQGGFGGPPAQFNGAPGAPAAQRSPQPPAAATPSTAAFEPARAPEAAQASKQATSAAESSQAAPAKAEDKSSADKVLEEMSKLSVSKPPATSASPSSLPPAAHHLPPIPRAAAAAANAAAQSERRNGAGSGAAPRGGNNRERQRGGAHGAHGATHEVGGPSMPNREFDFESANAKFQKHKDAGDEVAGSDAGAGAATGGLLEAIPPPSSESPGGFYDKSGFFDNISSEIKERYERTPGVGPGAEVGGEASSFFDAPGGRGGRGGRGGGGRGRGRANRIAEEMKNMQTFGDTGASVGGGGGRGGRGRGRPRGRGRGRPGNGEANANGFNTAPMRLG